LAGSGAGWLWRTVGIEVEQPDAAATSAATASVRFVFNIGASYSP